AVAVPAVDPDRRPPSHRSAGGPPRRAGRAVGRRDGHRQPHPGRHLGAGRPPDHRQRPPRRPDQPRRRLPRPDERAVEPPREGAVMKELRSLIATEARLVFRDPITWLAAIALPTVILLIFGTVFGPEQPDPALGGLRFIDVFVPSL